MAGPAVRGDLGWRKMEERREEKKKLLYGRRFEDLEEDRLVCIFEEKLKTAGEIGWREEYEVLMRKYGIDVEEGSATEWKRSVSDVNSREWQAEVGNKSSLCTYAQAKQTFGTETYTRVAVGHEAARLRFRLRTGSAGLLQDKKRCRMCEDRRCVLCDRLEEEDVGHFVLRCEEFGQERRCLLQSIGGIVGAEEWVKEYSDGDEGKKVAMMLGRKPAEMDGEVMDRIHEKIMRDILTWWQKR